MPRYTKRKYQVGIYYLSQRPNSPAWCRTWYDKGTKQTKRESLETDDFEEAKQRLDDWYFDQQSPQNVPVEEVVLAQVLANYWEHHGRKLPSAEAARLSLRYWLEFFEEKTVAEIAPVPAQEAFHAWLFAKGMKASNVSRILSVGRAAINRAWKRGELTSAPFIHDVPKAQDAAPPRGRPMEVDEIGALFEATTHLHLRLFILFMLGTAARPDAVKELTLDRCDIESRLIILNPAGRAQTKKYRPTVKMPESLVPLVQNLKAHGSANHVVGGKTTPIKEMKTSWRNARAKAGLDDHVNPYSLRHTMARWLRKEGVEGWQVAAQLGHKRRDLSITEVYAPYDPAYLADAQRAIDSFFDRLRAKSVLVERMLGSEPLAQSIDFAS